MFSGCHSNIYHKTSRPLCESSVVNIHGVHDGMIMAQRRGRETNVELRRRCRGATVSGVIGR